MRRLATVQPAALFRSALDLVEIIRRTNPPPPDHIENAPLTNLSMEHGMDAEIADFKRGLLRIRCAIADLRTTLAGRRLAALLAKANFDPNQPRIPAGFSDGGQWTGAADPRIGSDLVDGEATGPDAETILVAAADRPPYGQYTVDLLDEEWAAGGHVISRHVENSESYLIRSIQGLVKGGKKGTDYVEAHGSFTNLRIAQNLVNKILISRTDVVDYIAQGRGKRARLRMEFNYVTGMEAYRTGGPKSPIRLRKTTSVYVIIDYAPNLPKGYMVVSAYPSNLDKSEEIDKVPLDLIEGLKSMIDVRDADLWYYTYVRMFEPWTEPLTDRYLMVDLPRKYMSEAQLKDLQLFAEKFLKQNPTEEDAQDLWERGSHELVARSGKNAHLGFFQDMAEMLPRWTYEELQERGRATSPKRRHSHKRRPR